MKMRLAKQLFICTLSLSVIALSSKAAIKRPVSKDTMLKPFKISYALTASDIPFDGSATSILSENNNQWSLVFSASAAVISFSEKSRFIYSKNGTVQPVEYEMKRLLLGSDTTDRIQYNWHTGQATYYQKDKKYLVKLVPGSLDDMSYQVQLRQDLMNNKKPLVYKIVRKHNEPEDLEFMRDGEETLKTPLGNIKTLRLKTVRKNNKRETWIWLAHQWQYLPVKIKQRTGSQTFEVKISGGIFNGEPLKVSTEGKDKSETKLQSEIKTQS